MKKIEVSEPVYREKVPIFYDACPAQMNDYLATKYGIEQDVVDEGSSGMMVELTGEDAKYFLVWLEQFKNEPFYIGILCHEMNHLALAILRDVGIKACPETEESFTYLQQYYVTTFLNKFAKRELGNAPVAPKKKRTQK